MHRAEQAARRAGLGWLPVDHAPELTGFYRDCGFTTTQGGLIRLRPPNG